jgi:hypothetical protein
VFVLPERSFPRLASGAIVLLMFLYFRRIHSRPYATALTALTRLRMRRAEREAQQGKEGNFEMTSNSAEEPSQ